MWKPQTGQYVTSIDLGLQNSITAIDPTTGAKIVDPRSIPGDGETKMICPHVGGGRSWAPTAYNPETKIVYVPITEACMDMVPVGEDERGSLSTGVRWTVRPRPESDGNYGRLEAVNLETHETVWIARQRAPQTTGALVTAGGRAVCRFARPATERLRCGQCGERLWATPAERRAQLAAHHLCRERAPVRGGITTGAGGYLTGAYSVMAPEIQNPTDRSATLWVFEEPR